MLQTSVESRKKTRRRSAASVDSATVVSTEPGTGSGSQAGITCDRQLVKNLVRVHRGVDFLKVNYWLQWHEFNFLEIMDHMKRMLQDTDEEQVAIFRSKGLEWNLKRTGTSKFKYILKSGDVTLLFNRREPKGNIPNFRLEIGSLTAQTCLLQTVNDIRHWLERQGAEFQKERVAEVHLAADFIGLDIKTIGIEDQERWIQRSNSFSPYYEHRKLTGISMGKGDFMLRVYDKVTELKRTENKQEIFRDLWKVKDFNEYPVTRVEYQLRRPVLKEFNHLEYCNGIDTVKQLFFGLRAVWKYATTDWSRFMATMIDRDNRNQSRAIYSDFWSIVRAVAWTGIEELRREKKTKHKDIEALRKQARGILMSVAAFFVTSSEDIDQIVSHSQELIENDLREFFEDRAKFIKRMDKKRNEIILDTVPF